MAHSPTDAHRPHRRARGLAHALAIALALMPAAALASQYAWDSDGDGIDDRIETVNALGYQFAFVNSDSTGAQRIEVSRQAPGLVYGIYVIYDHVPTTADFTALATLGLPVLHRYEGLPAVRSSGTFAQVAAAAALPGTNRVEAVPVLYPLLRENTASAAIRDPSERVFPTWSSAGGADGAGSVIAFLDTGINDAADGAFPGHESVKGRCVGGAAFQGADSTLDTPPNGSVNPEDHGTTGHGTHVAGIAAGSGGESAFARGAAPGASFVDVKVLSDAGVGLGVAEGIDWCIHNRARVWGAGANGIQVINLSLASPDWSDGNDLTARLAQRASELGIVVVAAMGNDGAALHVPSPAAGDGVIAVGAYDVQRTPRCEDDQFASFGNRGPRASDGDGDALDELKPDLLAPGVAVLSADGALTSDGHQYARRSGTSMAAAFVSGAVACLRAQYPSLTPAAIADLLHRTAWRGLAGVPAGAAGADPRWQSARGFGVLDLYAAKLELDRPGRTQVTRLELEAGADSVRALVRTQRERGAAFVVIERAADAGGSPGAFAAYDSLPTAGDSSLAGVANRSSYAFAWSVPVPERGQAFWYRAAYTENGVRWSEPARRFTSPSGPPVATAVFSIAHNALDHDLTGTIEARDLSSSTGAVYAFPLPGTTAADSTDFVDGASTFGNDVWNLHVDFTDPGVSALLPPGPSSRWDIRLAEGGYLNLSGRLLSYRLIWHSPGGDLAYDGGPVPLLTVEGAEVQAIAPQGAASVATPDAGMRVRFGPSPVGRGGRVRFEDPRGLARELRVFDVSGREVGRAGFTAAGAARVAVWSTRDDRGALVAPGVYLARVDGGRAVRMLVLTR
jgi:subtilisin family serine protease